MNKLFLALGLVAFFTSFSAFADEAQPAAQLPQAQEKLESGGQLALRASSPDADFGTKGETIGWVKQGEAVTVLSLKQVSTVLGFEVWVEVRATNGAQGWVYDGMTSDVLHGHANLTEKQALGGLLAKAN